MKKLVVLGCVMSVLFTGLIIIGCGGGGGEGNTAEEAAKGFFAAYENNDADTSWDLLSEASRKQVTKEDWKSYLKESDRIKFTVGAVTVNGDKATAKVTADTGSELETEEVPIVKEGGQWKVDMAGINTED